MEALATPIDGWISLRVWAAILWATLEAEESSATSALYTWL